MMQNLLDDGVQFKAATRLTTEQSNWVFGSCARCDAVFLPKKPASRYANNADPMPCLCGFCATRRAGQ